jgi:17beta-estradiol 17-dehydrogenase / very-long-chain 3-oxoacyl-CoA reductase
MFSIEDFLFLIGLNYILHALFKLFSILPALFANKNISDYGNGSWALITGCTDGIGKAFAITLAKQGFNIVQVSRNPEKLASCASDLKSKYGVEVRNIVKDFTHSTQNPILYFEEIHRKTLDLDISILINNVGTGARSFLHETLEKRVLDILSVNLFPITYLSRLITWRIKQRELGGAIINISSMRANGPAKRFVAYSATKAFNLVISELAAVDESFISGGRKVDVLGLKAGFVDTKLIKSLKFKPLMISPTECAEAALKCLGKVNSSGGHWKHLIINAIIPHLLKFQNN